MVLPWGTVYSVEEQYQVPEDKMLQKAEGEACLRRFLEGKGLFYEAGDAIDQGRFVKDIVPGTTPVPDMPQVYTTRAIHERFLAAPGLRLIPDGSVVRRTALKSLEKGRVVVRLPDGRSYDDRGCVEGPEGRRRRVTGELTTLPVDDSVYLTLTDSTYGVEWVKEDAEPGKVPKPPVPPPPPPATARITASTWEKVLEHAAQRPLISLEPSATRPTGGER
ncbi:MAG: hypothetical protein HXY20_05055 [Acidobacteria bacterium]|nr:hypothetical protein [Acidobacteriota bacterium]